MIEIEKIIRDLITSAIGDLNLSPTDFVIERPDNLARGDYATNIALVLAKVTGQAPLALAQRIAEKLKASPLEFPKARPWLERIEVATPGFINFFLTREFFADEVSQMIEQGDKYGAGTIKTGRKIMVEYTDPNPFKEFHVGHLMSNTIGESISRLIESQGAEVKRVCYQGDVGLHVAKSIWAALKNKPNDITDWAKCYATAAQSYEADETAKQEINEINKRIYDQSNSEINALYGAGRKLSLVYFETIYKRLGTKFDYYFFESESGLVGQKLVEDNLGKIFESSDGAVIFRGEKYAAPVGGQGLHTCVFLNSEGLPTYEAKELGLAKLKFEQYPYGESIVITGNEVTGYFAVLKKVLELIFPDLAKKTKHLPHGMLRLATGKMSSRTGSVITVESLLTEVKAVANQKVAVRDFDAGERERVAEAVAIGAIKYSILKQSPGRDIIFDLAKSLSLAGDSGPHLQYSYVRARAVMEKARAEKIPTNLDQPTIEISELERRLARFPE